jgi:hypothetical protein
VLERLAGEGLLVAAIPGTAKVRVTIPNIEAQSEGAAKEVAVSRVKGLLPEEGYVVSNPELQGEEDLAPAMAGSSA